MCYDRKYPNSKSILVFKQMLFLGHMYRSIIVFHKSSQWKLPENCSNFFSQMEASFSSTENDLLICKVECVIKISICVQYNAHIRVTDILSLQLLIICLTYFKFLPEVILKYSVSCQLYHPPMAYRALLCRSKLSRLNSVCGGITGSGGPKTGNGKCCLTHDNQNLIWN